MKKLIAAFCLVAFVGVFANAQTTAAESKKATKGEVVKCTEAEKASCESKAAQTGAKCETTDAKATAGSGCASSAKAGSCCKSGTASTGSCCSKGKGEDKAEAAPSDNNMKKSSAKTAQVTSADKK